MTDTNSSIQSFDKEQVGTSPITPLNNNSEQESRQQQQQNIEDIEGFSSTGLAHSSCRSDSAITGNMETAQSSQMTQSSQISDKKPSKIITFEDLVAGKTKFKTWSAEKKELDQEEEAPVAPQPSVTSQIEEPVKQPKKVSNIRKKWESGNISEDDQQQQQQQQQQQEDINKDQDQSPKKDDVFKSIMNRFKHLEMTKADNIIFDQEDENKSENVRETLVSGKASMFEKMSQNQQNNSNYKQKKQQQKGGELERIQSDPESVRGKAAIFEAQHEK